MKLFCKQDLEWGSPLFIALDDEYWTLREEEFADQVTSINKKNEISLIWFERWVNKTEESWGGPSPPKRAASEGAASAGGAAFK